MSGGEVRAGGVREEAGRLRAGVCGDAGRRTYRWGFGWVRRIWGAFRAGDNFIGWMQRTGPDGRRKGNWNDGSENGRGKRWGPGSRIVEGERRVNRIEGLLGKA